MDLTGAGGDGGGGGEGASPTTSSSDSALSGSVPEREDDDPLRLHEQIVAFARRRWQRRPRDAGSARGRRAAASSCVRRVFPSARLACFGSGARRWRCAARTSTWWFWASAHRVDRGRRVQQERPRRAGEHFARKSRALRRERAVARARGIYTAKVPIVKAHTTGDDASGFLRWTSPSARQTG